MKEQITYSVLSRPLKIAVVISYIVGTMYVLLLATSFLSGYFGGV